MGRKNETLEVEMEKRGYITVIEAARRLRMSSTAIYTGIESGALKETRVGKRRFVEVASLLKYAGPVGAKVYEATRRAT
jgi:excisionase family DNA binding protein